MSGYDLGSTNSVRTSVSATTSSIQLLAAQPLRILATITNNSNKPLFLALGPGGSSSDFSVEIGPGGYYELPTVWRGVVTGAWKNGANGEARITEVIP